jgi:dynein heavy chain
MIMDGDNELNKIELDFFLKGNTSLEPVSREKPYVWLSNNGWKDLQKLVNLGEDWKTIIDNVENHGHEWKEWYDLESPENTTIPCGYSEKLTKFQQLLIVRIFRSDRVVNAIKNFIIEKMNDYYIKSPPIRYDKIFE